MLELVDTPGRLVLLTPLGQRFVRSDMEERRHVWRAQLQKLRLFKAIRELLELRGGELGREDALAEIRQRLPREDGVRIFETVVGWGRFGGLLAYHEESGTLSRE